MSRGAISYERLKKLANRDEAFLRDRYPDGLPDGWEEDLARHPGDTAMSMLYRVVVLKSFFRERHAEREAKAEPTEDAQTAARKLLQREPVRVELDDVVAHVTARSYTAMQAIAAHDLRIRELGIDLRRAAELHALTRAELGGLRWYERRGHLRRRLKRLSALHTALYVEVQAHRQMLYAHAMTPDGAPASSPEEAPEWWTRVDAAWDAALLSALMEAGPGRYARLGPPPKREGGKKSGESFGYASLFAGVERDQKIEAASLYDRDLFQTLTWLRAGAPPEIED